MTDLVNHFPPHAQKRNDFAQVRALVAKSSVKVVVLDDDPTGTQTVHGIDVLSDWSVAALRESLSDPRAGFYLLTNTRSLPSAEAIAINREIAANLQVAAKLTGCAFTVVSRSDSTLRGHFPAETDTLLTTLPGKFHGVVLLPAFIEGGRHTVDNIHYLTVDGRAVPVAETEFARDATFGFTRSDLREWVEEKTIGVVAAKKVAVIRLATLRAAQGARAVRTRLLALNRGVTVIVNAVTYADIEVFVHGVLQAEAAGRRFLFRTAASFVRIRLGLAPRQELAPIEMCHPSGKGGLVIVGSYVDRSTRQLESALRLPRVHGLEVKVDLLSENKTRELEVTRVATSASRLLRRSETVVIYTSRQHISRAGRAGDLGTSQTVSRALVAIVRQIAPMPRFFIAKGGITSSDLAVHGFAMRRALVMGQAMPGVPVWRLGEDSRRPGMPYVVFPGNVGSADALSRLIRRLNAVPVTGTGRKRSKSKAATQPPKSARRTKKRTHSNRPRLPLQKS